MSQSATQPGEPVRQFLARSDSGDAFAAENLHLSTDQVTFLNTAVNHFAGGLQALERRLYPEAVQRFTDFLTTVTQGPSLPDRSMAQGIAEKLAMAHFYAAVALLGGATVGNKSPQVIAEVDNHLEHARGAGTTPEVFHPASVLWAIVKEDSRADGMFVRPPGPEELARSLPELTDAQAAFISAHLGNARGRTFEALRGRSGTPAALESGKAPVPTPVQSAERARAVDRFFIRSAGFREVAWGVVGVLGLFVFVGGLTSEDRGSFACLGIIAAVMVIAALSKTWWVIRAYPKPTNQQMDAWLAHDVQTAVVPRALANLRLDSRPSHEGGDLVVPPQIVVGVAEPQQVMEGMGERYFMVKRCTDHRLRATHYDVLILFMTDKIVSAYRAWLETRSGRILVDRAQEHLYRDISGVAFATVPANIPPHVRDRLPKETRDRMSAYHVFSLNVVDGRSLSIAVATGDALDGATEGIAWGNEQSLSMIQRMIRGKKEA